MVEPKEKEEIRILMTANQVECPDPEGFMEDIYLWMCKKLDEMRHFENGTE